jgi:hypothetical protein
MHSYVVPMRWVVIYEYEVLGEALNINSTNYLDQACQTEGPSRAIWVTFVLS